MSRHRETSLPSCFVVGRGAIATRCLEILGSHGWSVRGVFSADGSLRSMAERHGWPHIPDRSSFCDALEAGPYDHLFSIDNGWILPPQVLATPQGLAVNYHDAPLPAYAGLHATSWALIRGERFHGITWHEIEEGIDTGRILEQRVVKIADDDTAFTLNTRCFETAVEAFGQLVCHIASDHIPNRPQPALGRSYFGRRDRPAAACVVSFAESATDIDRLIRGLDFGPSRNPLGLPKVWLGTAAFAPTSCTMHPERSGRPGEVVGMEPGRVRIGTATTDLTLSGWRSLSGAPLTDAEVAACFGPLAGTVLGDPGSELRAELSALDADVCVHEPFFASALTELSAAVHPYANEARPAPVRRVALDLGGPVPLLALFAAYVLRVSDRSSADIGFGATALDPCASAVFADIVPIRLTTPPDERFDCFAVAVKRAVDEALRRKTYALDLVAREPSLRGAGPPVLPVVIRLADSPSALDAAPRGTAIPSNADLTFVVFEDGSPPELLIGVDLEPWQVDAIGAQLRCMATAIRRDSGTPVSTLPLLAETERDTIVRGWNETTVPLPDATMHSLIRLRAETTPDAPAVRFAGRSLTYRELMERTDQLASALATSGVGRGDVVALSLPRGPDVVAAMLAVLETGAAYLPIDPSYPVARVAHILADSGADVVITDRSLRDSLYTAGPARAVLVDELVAAYIGGPPVDSGSSPDDLAYVIYTSGSTGAPKGVDVMHRGLVNHGLAIAANYSLGPGDRMLCSASIGFDVAGEQIYPALLSGAEVVMRPDDLFDSFSRFDSFVRAEGISAMVLPTAFWHEWVRELQRRDSSLPPALRCVSTGTEKVLAPYLAAWQEMSGGRVRFFQGYGPTETTITCTMYAHDGSPVDAERAVPIGRPLPNMKVHILDSAMQPVPVGMPGEIYVGGVGLARGYRANPAMTAERFVADPFKRGGRLYRTGDIGRYEPDGQIVYIARTDSQVKVRGHRVELGEIENVLRAHADVDDAVVIVDEEGGHSRLLAYVVTREDVPSLLDHVASQLPDYMMPAAVVQLREFPKTPNQKVDRRALPRPESSSHERQAARTATEARLQALWEVELEHGGFGVLDSFFDLGGDSLRAVSMLSAVEAEFEMPILLSAFVREPTISGLASLLELPRDAESPENLVVVVQAGRRDLSPLWLIHPVGGHVVYGNYLRVSMDPEQPLFGIQARGLDGRAEPHTSVAAMAAEYASLIRARQPEGPYFLAGPSMGGYIAIEVARRLEDAGGRIALLALMDAWGPEFPRPTSKVVRLWDNTRAVAAMPQRERMGALMERLRTGTPREAPFEPPRYDVLDHLSSRLAGGGATLIRTIEAVTHANEEANRGHVVHAFKTPVLLLRADRRAKWSGMRYDDPTNGWARYARGGLSIIGFDYDHRELVDEPGPAVGLALQTAIDAARDATRELGPGLDGWPGIAGQCANATTSWSERNTISSTELPAS